MRTVVSFLIIDLAPSRAGKSGPCANQQGPPRARIPVVDGLRGRLVPIWHGINKTTCALQTHLSLSSQLVTVTVQGKPQWEWEWQWQTW